MLKRLLSIIFILIPFVFVSGEVSTIQNPVELTSTGKDSGPRVSPDGEKIVFYSNRDGNYNIYVMNTDGSGMKQLTDNTSNEVDPDFHPTEKSIIYASDETGSYEIYKMDLDSRETTQLTHNTPYDARHPRVSPIKWEGMRDKVEEWDWGDPRYQYYNILYEGVFEDRSELYVVSDFEDNKRQITRTTSGDVKHEIYGYYSPDGRYEKVSSSTFINPEWFDGGLHILSIGEIAGVNHIITLRTGLEYWVPEKKNEMEDIMMATPSVNQTQLLLLKDDGELTIYEVKTGEEYSVGKIKGEFTQMGWAPDGKYIVYSTDGNIYLQKLKNPLSEITNLWLYDYFTTDQIDTLVNNGFVVTDRFEKNIFEHYPYYVEGYKKPFFITTDVTLHLFYLFYDYLLVEVETNRMVPLVEDFITRATMILQGEVDNHSGVERELLEYIRDYFLVAWGLIEPTIRGDAYPERVKKEWANIDAKSGSSSMFPYPQPVNMDYTQFNVRGHYDVSEDLRRYFRTVMWFGQGKLPLNNKNSQLNEMMLSLYFVELMKDEELSELYDKFYDVVSVLFGPPESVTLKSLGKISDEVFGSNPTYSDLVEEEKVKEVYEKMSEEIEPPKIFPDQGYTFKLLPQVFATDTYILQQLMFSEVGTFENPRLLPKGLDLMSAFGSENAEEYLLELYNEDRYTNYTEKMEEVREFVNSLDPEWAMKTIYSGWLEMLRTSFVGKNDERYPDFMRTSAWEDKSLMTALSSWTELRHTAVLYVGGAGAYGSGGGPPEFPIIPSPKGYVEPNDNYYYQMLSLLERIEGVFTEKDMWYEKPAEVYNKLYAILEKLGGISEKELVGIERTDDEYAFIDELGDSFEQLGIQCMSTSGHSMGDVDVIEGQSMALVVDIATGIIPGEGTFILHEAIGNSPEIDCIYPVDGVLQIAKGGTFSYYEFVEEGKRLSDMDWKSRLMGGDYFSSNWGANFGGDDLSWEERDKYRENLASEAQEKFEKSGVPQMPEWTKSFFVPTYFTVITDALNMRTAPRLEEGWGGTAGEVITVLHKGDRLQFMGEEKEDSSYSKESGTIRYHWCMVALEDGTRGWVCSELEIWKGGIMVEKEVYLK